MREIVLDTETTGLNKKRCGDICSGHRIIEIGCVEILDGVLTGNDFHVYVQVNQNIDDKAEKIHGITNDFLKDKPFFKDVVDSLLRFIGSSRLIMHNAAFDIAFLNQEFELLSEYQRPYGRTFTFLDTLLLARQKFPGRKNTLDALAKRYGVGLGRDRNVHGALLDARILAEIYLKL